MKHIYIFYLKSVGSRYGIGTYICQLSNFLRINNNISLNIVELYSEENEFYMKEFNRYRLFFFPKISNPYFSENINKYNRNVWLILQSYIILGTSDQLIFHLNFNSEYTFIALFKAKFPSCKVFYTIHYIECFSLVKENADYLKKIFQKSRISFINEKEKRIYTSYEEDNKILNNADKIICLSKYTYDVLIDLYCISYDKIELIPNGLKDEGRLLTQKKKFILRNELLFSAKDIIILFVGRLEEAKGVGILIDAFKKVVDVCPNARLVLIGGGDFNNYFAKAKGYWSKITFTGLIEKDNLYKFYEIASVGVIPSGNEQCSYVAIEMMMHSLPMVVVDSTGLSEMLDPENKYYVVPIDETSEDRLVNMLCDKIIKALSDKSYNYRIRKNYLRHFTIEDMEKKYLKIYQ